MAKDLVIRKLKNGVRLTLHHGTLISVDFYKGDGTKENPLQPRGATFFPMIRLILAKSAFLMNGKKLYFTWQREEDVYSINNKDGEIVYEGPAEHKTAGDEMAKSLMGK